MKITFSENSLRNLADIMDFYSDKISSSKIDEIIRSLISKTSILKISPYAGQKEIFLEHLNQGHRRLVAGNYKIVYLVLEDKILITDIFDARQDPVKMKG